KGYGTPTTKSSMCHLCCSAHICFLTASYLWFMYCHKLDVILYKYQQKDLFRYSRKVECLQRWFPRCSRRPYPIHNIPSPCLTSSPSYPIGPFSRRGCPFSPTTTSATMPICTPIPIPTQVPEAHNALTSTRKVITTSNPSGSAMSHVIVRCTFVDIAHPMNLRVEDACGCWT
ncbi:hypothetical protein EDC04DRAFT_2733449, partial [Pisolithus marmoratus]